MIMAVGHGSILEHVSFTFAVEDISRVTEIQFARHRMGSPSIQSGRYVRRNPHFFLPEEIANDEEAFEIYLSICEHSTNAYLDLIDRLEIVQVAKKLGISKQESALMQRVSSNCKDGVVLSEKEMEIGATYEKARKEIEKLALEDARYALLQSLRTHMVYSMDLRNLLHFVGKRRCKRAQTEIRMAANQMYEIMYPIMPNVMKFSGAPCEFGPCPEGNLCCGMPYPRREM
jgi:thymidylate synthase (FAD)